MIRSARDTESKRMDRAMGAEICQARGEVTQVELARRLGSGWTQKRVSKIESGEQPAHARDLDQIARALGKDAGEMLNAAIARFLRESE